MRWMLLTLVALLPLTGCKAPSPDGAQPNVTPVDAHTGTVALVNTELKYVVVQGSLAGVPKPDTVLGVYRGGMKVGEVKATSKSNAQNYAADIISGEAKVGDSIRGN